MKKNLLTSLLLFAATTVGAQSWIDITSEYVRNTDYVSGNYDGWTFVGAAGSTATRCNAQEFWNGYWDFSQTVAVPQEGKYRVSVQGYYRVSDNSYENVTAYEEGTEDITCYLYANDDAVKMASVYSAFFTEDQGGTWRYGSGWGWWDDDVRFYPNTMETGTALFERGEYQNQLETTVGADRKLTIGIRNANQSNSNWTLFTNWKLEMYGTEVKMTKMAFEQTSARVTQGDELQMQLAITPSNATYQSVAYTSSNEAVATVDENGLVRTMKPGITTITATSTKYEDISCRCLVTVEANEVASASIIINEVQQANVDMFIDPSFNYGGWIELYNSSDSEVTLDGLYISDDRGHRMALTSSRHGTLPAKGFLALWFDHYSWWTPKTLNFKLDTDGGYIAISDAQGTVLSQFNYPPAITRTSYARTTDGGNEWGYTDQPTPGATNTTSKFATTRLAAPVIDHKGGLFKGHVTAVVTIPSRCTLRYTTDGSTPTMENGQTSAGGRFDFDKTTVLRLRLYKDGQLSSPVVTRSFILNDNDYTLPVLSLVSDPKNLTGNEYGIFARGSGNGRPGNGQSGKCNWNMDWDRPANVEYIGEDGQVAFNQEVSVEVSGGWSRAWTPQSFNIKANKMYEGVNRMDYQFFKDKPYLRHKGLKVRNGGNDYNNGRIKDAALQQVVATSGLYVETQSYQPVHVYRNGRYVGLLNLREPNNKNYGFANYGIDTDDEDMDQWKMSPDSGYVQQVGTRDVFDEWYSLSWNAADALTYERIKQIVDIEEMCNYLAVQFYLCGNDWPKNNIKAFRARTEGESNSRFRAILFDLDHAFNNGTNEFNWFFNQSQYWTFDQLYGSQVIAKYGNRITAEIEFVTIIKNMLENEEFKKQLIDQFCIVAGSVFEPKRSSEIVQGMIDRVAKDGFSATSGYDVKNKLSSSRQSSTVDNMRNYFGLGSARNVTLSANFPEAGVMINGLNVPTNRFSGKLFAPITVTTAAPAGYRFVGWQSNLATTGTTVFGKGTDWNYYDQGSLDGEDWTAADYDAVWPNGQAPLGYFVTDGSNSRGYQTFLGYGGDNNSKYPTYYFRKQMTLDGKPKNTESFTLNWVADDGFIIYVNGVEAGRYLMPSGNVGFNTFATTYANDNPDSGNMTIAASLFKKGVNTIAVELHNNAANSTDVMWDAELVYFKENAGNIASTETAFVIPENASSITLTAIYEKMNDGDAGAWDAHPVKINEVSADNELYVSESFKKSDWIELYNTTDAEIDVAGMYLSDHLETPEKWQIPASDGNFSTIIPAHGHLVVWCDKTASKTQLHADFKLNNEDSCLIVLTAEDKSWADTLVYCRHDGYHSVGLYPDGGSQLFVMERPTIGTSNMLTTLATTWKEPFIERHDEDGMQQLADDDMLLVLNARSLVLNGADAARLDIYNAAGQMVMTTRISQTSPVSLDGLPRGVYIARAKTDDDETSLKFTLQ